MLINIDRCEEAKILKQDIPLEVEKSTYQKFKLITETGFVIAAEFFKRKEQKFVKIICYSCHKGKIKEIAIEQGKLKEARALVSIVLNQVHRRYFDKNREATCKLQPVRAIKPSITIE